jgi:hypothetical protein
MQAMGSRDEKSWNKFLESPSYTAMLRMMILEAIFIPKECQVKAPLSFKSATLQSNLNTLVDSGATDNFISLLIINHFNIPTYELLKPKTVCNVDRSKNSIGPMIHATNLEVYYNDNTVYLCFLIANLGSDSMLPGMPFLATFNLEINWMEGTFHGNIEMCTSDSHLWMPQIDSQTKKTLALEEHGPEDYNRSYIPNNEYNITSI